MPQYTYTIVDGSGNLNSGTLTAADRQHALEDLSGNGQKVVSLQESSSGKHWWNKNISLGSSLAQKDIILITKRISNMTTHGFSIIDSLRNIELQTQNPRLKEVAEHLRRKVEIGNSLSESLKDYPESFSNVYTSIVRVGEESGKIAEVMQYLEKQETQTYELKKKAIGAMIYPGIIAGIMIIVAVGMILFLIPFLKDIFSSFQSELPAATRLLMNAEPLLRNYWWAFLGGIIALILLIKVIKKQPEIKNAWDKITIHTPFIGSLVKQYNVAQIIRTFATLNKSGVPMSDALDILSTVPNNLPYRKAMETIKRDVERGAIFSAAMNKHSTLFPPLVIESLKLGEKTGNLNDSSNYLAELYEEELKETLQTLTTLIQPLMLVLVGVMVAGFALAVITPLQRLPQLIQQGTP